ncbi:MAG: glycosyl transferase [Gemmatimonadaceae bacterium]|nr:glycosyl transferase [Gloeobacterales cyanobacterium ES-bin-141]
MPLTLCLYSSAHGFGHTTRLLAIAAAVLQLAPRTRIILNSQVPEWLVDVHCRGVELRRRALDVGLVQSDSFTTDEAATLEQIQALREREESLVREETDWLRSTGVDAVLADIPPLAGALAQSTGLPVWGVSNFGWDYIYNHMGKPFVSAALWAAQHYRQYTGLFRLPLSEPMQAFARVEPVPLVVNQARFGRSRVRVQLGLGAWEPVALMTFGGLGMEGFPAARVAENPDWRFLVTNPAVPDQPNILKVEGGQWRLIELLGAADLALIKPGYSTVAECCALDLPTVCLERPGFAEAEVLINGIKRYLPHYILSVGELFEQPWHFLRHPLEPARSASPSKAGAHFVAERLLSCVG